MINVICKNVNTALLIILNSDDFGVFTAFIGLQFHWLSHKNCNWVDFKFNLYRVYFCVSVTLQIIDIIIYIN